jgi:hypothetical protein
MSTQNVLIIISHLGIHIKTPIAYHCTFIRMPSLKKRLIIASVAKMPCKWSSHTLLVGRQNYTITLEMIWLFLKSLHMLTRRPNLFTCKHLWNEINANIFQVWLLIAPLFVISKNWKELKCLLMGKCIKTLSINR